MDLGKLMRTLRDAAHDERVLGVNTSKGRLADIMRLVANELEEILADVK